MFETLLTILLIILALTVAFALGRIWNERPRIKEVIRPKGLGETQDAIMSEFALELKKRTRAIRQYSQKIDKNAPTDNQIFKIEKMSARMDGMLNLLVAFAKLSDVELEVQEVSLEEAVTHALNEMKGKGENLPRVEIGSMQKCKGDPALLKQFFVILFRNATPTEGKARIEIGSLDGGREGLGKFFFKIETPARGVDPANPFLLYNVQRKTTTPSGRGLAFCKKIISLHGGKLWCQGGHDGSVTFWYSLPVVLSHRTFGINVVK